MLANYEEQFYISTGATLNENLSYEAHKEKLQEKINKKIMKEKALKELETKTQTLSGDKSTSDTDDCIDENVNHKVVVSLNIVDSVVSNFMLELFKRVARKLRHALMKEKKSLNFMRVNNFCTIPFRILLNLNFMNFLI